MFLLINVVKARHPCPQVTHHFHCSNVEVAAVVMDFLIF
jgi:hypothetical protein